MEREKDRKMTQHLHPNQPVNEYRVRVQNSKVLSVRKECLAVLCIFKAYDQKQSMSKDFVMRHN